MAVLKQVIDEFKDLLIQRNIKISGKLVFDFDDLGSIACQEFIRELSIDAHSEGVGSKGDSFLKCECEVHTDCSNNDFSDSLHSCQRTLPPIENIVQSRNSEFSGNIKCEVAESFIGTSPTKQKQRSSSDEFENGRSASNMEDFSEMSFSNKTIIVQSPFNGLRSNQRAESTPSHSSAGASLLELLKATNMNYEVNDTVKRIVKNYDLSSLTKVELIDILLLVLGIEGSERTERDVNSILITSGNSETSLPSTKKKETRSSGRARKQPSHPAELKVRISNEKVDNSARKRACVKKEVVKCEENVANVSKKSGTSAAEDRAPKSKEYICKMCGSMFTSRSVYKKHLHTHTSSLKCYICDKIFKSKDSLYHHQRGLHRKEKPYHCDVCNSYFSFHHSYKLHLQKHKGDRPFSCELCPKTYLTASHLKEHTRAVHLNKSIICHVCGKTFSYSCTLKLHLQSHFDNKTYSCSTCNKEFNTKRALERHSMHHVENKRVKCNVCGKYFKSDYFLNIHSKIHSNKLNKRFSCDVCGKSFFYKCVLDGHLQIHSKIRSFACAICGKTFKSKASLYSHKYVHNEGLAYLCTICSKSFKTKGCLSAHMKRHQNQSTFVCSVCGKTFPDKGGLSKHTKTVHLPHRYYSCKICEKTGTRADNMRTHVKSHRNQVGPGDDPMNYIFCVEEPKTKMEESDLKHFKTKSNNKHTSDLLTGEDKTVTFIPPHKMGTNPLFQGGSMPLLPSSSAMPVVNSPSEFMNEKGADLTNAKTEMENNASKSSDVEYSYGSVSSGIPKNMYVSNTSSCVYSSDSAKNKTTSVIMSTVASPGLQMHSGSSSSFNQLLPSYYGHYIPAESVDCSVRAPPKSVDSGAVDWLATSSSQSV